MGDKVKRGSAMTAWWVVDIVSRLLEPDEREAVRGDLTESGARGGQALRDVLGLVVRRQAALWSDWRPWLTGWSWTSGFVLGSLSRRTLWVYGNAVQSRGAAGYDSWCSFPHGGECNGASAALRFHCSRRWPPPSRSSY